MLRCAKIWVQYAASIADALGRATPHAMNAEGSHGLKLMEKAKPDGVKFEELGPLRIAALASVYGVSIAHMRPWGSLTHAFWFSVIATGGFIRLFLLGRRKFDVEYNLAWVARSGGTLLGMVAGTSYIMEKVGDASVRFPWDYAIVATTPVLLVGLLGWILGMFEPGSLLGFGQWPPARDPSVRSQ